MPALHFNQYVNDRRVHVELDLEKPDHVTVKFPDLSAPSYATFQLVHDCINRAFGYVSMIMPGKLRVTYIDHRVPFVVFPEDEALKILNFESEVRFLLERIGEAAIFLKEGQDLYRMLQTTAPYVITQVMNALGDVTAH